jgi:hypothetical protein
MLMSFVLHAAVNGDGGCHVGKLETRTGYGHDPASTGEPLSVGGAVPLSMSFEVDPLSLELAPLSADPLPLPSLFPESENEHAVPTTPTHTTQAKIEKGRFMTLSVSEFRFRVLFESGMSNRRAVVLGLFSARKCVASRRRRVDRHPSSELLGWWETR